MSIAERDYMQRNDGPAFRFKWGCVATAAVVGILLVGVLRHCSHQEKEASKLSKSSLVLNINEASAEELETLPGVGPARAELIIQHRPYRSVDELFQKHALPRSVVDNDRELLKTSGKNERALKRK